MLIVDCYHPPSLLTTNHPKSPLPFIPLHLHRHLRKLKRIADVFAFPDGLVEFGGEVDGDVVGDLDRGADDVGDVFADGLGLVGGVAGVEEDAADGVAEESEDGGELGLAEFAGGAVGVEEVNGALTAVAAEVEEMGLEGHHFLQEVVGARGVDLVQHEAVALGGGAQYIADVAEFGADGEGLLVEGAGAAEKDPGFLAGIIVLRRGLDESAVAAQAVDVFDEVVGDLVELDVEFALGAQAQAAVVGVAVVAGAQLHHHDARIQVLMPHEGREGLQSLLHAALRDPFKTLFECIHVLFHSTRQRWAADVTMMAVAAMVPLNIFSLRFFLRGLCVALQ